MTAKHLIGDRRLSGLLGQRHRRGPRQAGPKPVSPIEESAGDSGMER